MLTTLDSHFPRPKPSIQSAYSENPGVDTLNRDPATPPREAPSQTSNTVPTRPASGRLERKGGCYRPWSRHPVQERSQQMGERLWSSLGCLVQFPALQIPAGLVQQLILPLLSASSARSRWHRLLASPASCSQGQPAFHPQALSLEAVLPNTH